MAAGPPPSSSTARTERSSVRPRLSRHRSAGGSWSGQHWKGSERRWRAWNNGADAYQRRAIWKEPTHRPTQRCWQAARALFLPSPPRLIHLGNFLGALRSGCHCKNVIEAFYGSPDLHALTVATPPAALRERTLRSAAQLLAAGIDPAKATVFLQSQVPEHVQLSWVLGLHHRLRTSPADDAIQGQGRQDGPRGHQRWSAHVSSPDGRRHPAVPDRSVPVGKDQRLASRADFVILLNASIPATGDIVVPEPYILPSGRRVADLAEPGTKMSKSLSSPTGIIELLDDPAINIRKIKSAVTDSGRRSSSMRSTSPASPIC